jgi:hypothetical protein
MNLTGFRYRTDSIEGKFFLLREGNSRGFSFNEMGAVLVVRSSMTHCRLLSLITTDEENDRVP